MSWNPIDRTRFDVDDPSTDDLWTTLAANGLGMRILPYVVHVERLVGSLGAWSRMLSTTLPDAGDSPNRFQLQVPNGTGGFAARLLVDVTAYVSTGSAGQIRIKDEGSGNTGPPVNLTTTPTLVTAELPLEEAWRGGRRIWFFESTDNASGAIVLIDESLGAIARVEW